MQLDTYLHVLQHRTEPVKLSTIPEELREDFQYFMYGRTVTKIDGELAFAPADYNEWVDKLVVDGVDYDILLE